VLWRCWLGHSDPSKMIYIVSLSSAMLILTQHNYHDPDISRDSVKRLLKTHLFSTLWSIRCIRGSTAICYINQRFTYLLTLSPTAIHVVSDVDSCGLLKGSFLIQTLSVVIQYTISRCAKNSKIIGYRRWPNMSRAVNKHLSVVENISEYFRYWLALFGLGF